jgi:WhiB family redox-sensing transcriptional regulator
MLILSCRSAPRASGVSSGDEMPDSWRDQASCLDVDAELFFPVGDGPVAREQAEEAKAVCCACPVLAECREFELTPVSGRLRSDDGVSAGMTADERRAELRRRVRQARRRGRAAGRGVAA